MFGFRVCLYLNSDVEWEESKGGIFYNVIFYNIFVLGILWEVYLSGIEDVLIVFNFFDIEWCWFIIKWNEFIDGFKLYVVGNYW